MEPECGICMVEERDVERGKLDCCDHFFCFPCIVEWSKVESKCPFCKQRFVKISKSPRPGARITRKCTIKVPTRDQVYVPSEEDQQQIVDDQLSFCTICFQPGDEFVVLCYVCDSMAHQYCADFGTGPWLCSNCSVVFGHDQLVEAVPTRNELRGNRLSTIAQPTASRRRRGADAAAEQQSSSVGDSTRNPEAERALEMEVERAWHLFEHARASITRIQQDIQATSSRNSTQTGRRAQIRPRFSVGGAVSRPRAEGSSLRIDETPNQPVRSSRLPDDEGGHQEATTSAHRHPVRAARRRALSTSLDDRLRASSVLESPRDLTTSSTDRQRASSDLELQSTSAAVGLPELPVRASRSLGPNERAKRRKTDDPDRESAKQRVSDVVKEQLQPLYAAKKLEREQYKSIARSVTHELLDLPACGDQEQLKRRAQAAIEKLLPSN